jgi:hypothetical protein
MTTETTQVKFLTKEERKHMINYLAGALDVSVHRLYSLDDVALFELYEEN